MKINALGQAQRSRFLVAAAFTLLLTASANAQTVAESYAELPNFHQVNAHIYRGAQPHVGGIRKLAQLGVKTVINLREGNDRADDEEAEAKAAGLRFINVPMPDFSRPRDEQVRQLLALLNASENFPVFIHCKRGADRTGTIIACYRIAHDGWTAEAALAEAKRYGMSWWQRGMKHFVEDFYEQHTAAASGQSRSRSKQ